MAINLLELYSLVEEQGIEIDDFRLCSVASISEMESDLTCHIALDSQQLHTTAEEKVALAHEYGHCATGAFYNRYSPFDSRARDERHANKKAVYTLIPLGELIDALHSPWNSVYDLSEHFTVTEDFMRWALEYYEWELREAFAREGEE